jgi:uncharacterized membrane protein
LTGTDHPHLSAPHQAMDDAVRAAPVEHRPKLEVSAHHRGSGILDRVAEIVNQIVGSMYVFVGVTIGIVVWLFAGNVVGFDKTPWPLLLTILNLPQLSIMISLQVSANLAQRTSDARAIADHQTLIALHELSTQQLHILHNQDRVLDLLRRNLPASPSS